MAESVSAADTVGRGVAESNLTRRIIDIPFIFNEKRAMNESYQIQETPIENAQQVLVTSSGGTSLDVLLEHMVAATVFSIVGIIVFVFCLVLAEKLTPFSIVHEIGEEHNMAVSIVVAAIVLGVSIIIAAAILG